MSLLLVVPADGNPAGAGGPLDRLAAVELTEAGDDVLRTAMSRLRQERLGDTLVFLTGPGGRGDLGHVGALRGAYPSVLVGVLGVAEPTPAGAAGLVVVDAADGAEFAAEGDGVRRRRAWRRPAASTRRTSRRRRRSGVVGPWRGWWAPCRRRWRWR